MSQYRKGALSTEYLKAILHYNPDTGIFIWLAAKGKRIKIGDVAGTKTNENYIVIKIDNVKYFAHRLAWFYMTGEWPEFEIDHENGVTDNNKWENLRKAKHIQNSKNRKLNVNSSTNLKGVHKRGDKYRSKISFNGKQICLGTFDTAKEASEAYSKAAEFYFDGFIREGLNV